MSTLITGILADSERRSSKWKQGYDNLEIHDKQCRCDFGLVAPGLVSNADSSGDYTDYCDYCRRAFATNLPRLTACTTGAIFGFNTVTSVETILRKLSASGRNTLMHHFGGDKKSLDMEIGRHLAMILRKHVNLKIIKKLPFANQRRIVNCIEMMIDEEPELARTAENLLNKLVELTGILPDGLFVNGVKRLGDNPVAGGGFADVWKGEIRGTSVALKVIRVYDLDIEFQKDCYKEVIVWRNICHPNVMPFIGVNVDKFKPRIALISPWMDNGHMLCYLKRHPGADRQKMIYEISLGLHYLHSRRPKIIHGDLRANNVLIDDLGCARIGDFGLVRIEDSLTSKAGSSFSGCGSLRWQAPELLCPFLFDLRGAPCRITVQTDIYAFACVCLEAFTGQPPFAHLREPAVVSEVGFLGKHPSRPGELGEDGSVQDAIWSVMSSCWSRQPSERPSSSQVAETLETISTRFASSSS